MNIIKYCFKPKIPSSLNRSCYIGNTDTTHHNGLQLDIFIFKEKDDLVIDKIQSYKFKKNDIFPIKQSTFEELKVSIPNNYDAVLRSDIGKDYMQLLPFEKRYPHESLGTGNFWSDRPCPHHKNKYPDLYSS